MKTYAYVTTETCRTMDAVKPKALIGRDEIQVSRHGDYSAWQHGKRETAAIIQSHATATNAYRRKAAKAVAELLGWFPMGDATYDRAGRK